MMSHILWMVNKTVIVAIHTLVIHTKIIRDMIKTIFDYYNICNCLSHDTGDSTTTPTPNPKCGGQYGIIPAGSITIVCNPTMNGRYVTIVQEPTGLSLSLCEVEVYTEDRGK
jgi:hypothetical protein